METMVWPLLVAGPLYLACMALVVGFVLTLLLGRAPGVTELAHESETRGSADHELIRQLDQSIEAKLEFMVRMGFKDLDYVAEESKQGFTVFRVTNPMPLSGGSYLVQFLSREAYPEVVASTTVLNFLSDVKHDTEVMKGVLVTGGAAFSRNAWGVLEKAQVELIDGKHLLGLFQMFYPEQFPQERI